jgi:hypothetical protein
MKKAPLLTKLKLTMKMNKFNNNIILIKTNSLNKLMKTLLK